MLNLILKRPTVVPPYTNPGEHSFVADEVIVQLGPEDELKEVRVLHHDGQTTECVWSQLGES